MGCFSVFPCFPSSNHPNLNKSLDPTTSSSSANQGTGKNREIVLIKAPVVESITNAGSLQTPVWKSRDNGEDQVINVGDSKTVAVDLDVVANTDISSKDAEIVSMKEGSGKLGVLVQLENERERDDEKKKENGKLGVLVQIEIENERKRGVNLEIENGKEIERALKEEIRSRAVSDSSASSYISYPPMHRYHSCVTHEDEELVLIEGDSPESLFSLSIDPSRQSKCCSVEDREVNSPLKTTCSPELIAKSNKSIVLVHPHEKENFNLQQEETSKDSVSDRKEKLKNDIAATPSLSSWLVGPEKSTALSKEQSQYSIGSDGASPLKRFEDRPILGALSLDEVKQISARSTPRKSPCPNPDDTPIIGTVGSYWSHTGQATDSSSSCTSPFGMSTKSRNRESKALSSKRRLERAFDKSTD